MYLQNEFEATDFEKELCRPFIYRRESKGRNVKPCGTPRVIVLTLEKCPGKLTCCFLFLRNDSNQLPTDTIKVTFNEENFMVNCIEGR